MDPDSFDHLKRLHLQRVRQAEEIQRALSPMIRLSESIRRNQLTWINQKQGLSGMSEWQRSISGVFASFQSTKLLLEGIQVETTRWSELLSGFQRQLRAYDLQALSLPATVWQDSVLDLAKSFRALRLPDTFPNLSQHLLAPHQEFSSFGRSVVADLEEGVDDQGAGEQS